MLVYDCEGCVVQLTGDGVVSVFLALFAIRLTGLYESVQSLLTTPCQLSAHHRTTPFASVVDLIDTHI